MTDKQNFIGAAIAGAAAKAVLSGALKEIIERVTDKETVKKVEAAVSADPRVVNQMNAEPLPQSRIAVGSSGALVPAVGYLIWAFSTNGFDLAGYDPSSTFLAVMTVAGSGYALYGRMRSGLKPLFSGK